MSAEPPKDASDAPGPPAPIQPTSSRTARGRRRLTAIPQDPQSPRNEGVKILRPSEVPERAPMPEYKPEKDTKVILPKHIPMDELYKHYRNDERKVDIPEFMDSEALMELAEKSGDVFTFRSRNHVDPEDVWQEIQMNEKEGKPKKVDDVELEVVRVKETDGDFRKAFVERSKQCFGRIVHGFSSNLEIDEKTKQQLVYATLIPPKGCIFEGGTYFLKIAFYVHPKFNYVLPHVQFRTMMFHPNLSKYGAFDVRQLIDSTWNHKSSLSDVYKWIVEQMVDLKRIIATKPQNQLEDMAQPDIAILASENWENFEKIAREMVIKMAGGSAHQSLFHPAKMRKYYSEEYGYMNPDDNDEIDIFN
ncbi:hypothetical protein L3Y34_014024 [Caenorhabditis briggsae]|uniref:UBC core domain-containing protein n=1 Tax=Caenorhabditis briggsae TaxID=6238 RepID=A0AAE9IWY3_CAEBR|nr:hypothetical protein L3Y34_014024 [Caenorhabditis briggsae]